MKLDGADEKIKEWTLLAIMSFEGLETIDEAEAKLDEYKTMGNVSLAVDSVINLISDNCKYYECCNCPLAKACTGMIAVCAYIKKWYDMRKS